MRKVLAITLVVLVSLVLSNCGKKLTAPEAKDVLAQKIGTFVSETGDLDDSEKETFQKISDGISITEVKPEGHLFTAKGVISIDGKAMDIEVKYAHRDGAWQAEEILSPDGNWTPAQKALEEARVNFLKEKQKTTMMDLKTLGAAIESYMTDLYFAPKVESVEELAKLLEPYYIKTAPLEDGFGYPFHYQADKDLYSLGSGGRGGQFDGFDQTGYYIIQTIEGFSKDIIFSNGAFVFSPKVK